MQAYFKESLADTASLFQLKFNRSHVKSDPLFIADEIIYAFQSSLKGKFIQFRVCVPYSEAQIFIFILKINTKLSGPFWAQLSIKLQLPLTWNSKIVLVTFR